MAIYIELMVYIMLMASNIVPMVIIVILLFLVPQVPIVYLIYRLLMRSMNPMVILKPLDGSKPVRIFSIFKRKAA